MKEFWRRFRNRFRDGWRRFRDRVEMQEEIPDNQVEAYKVRIRNRARHITDKRQHICVNFVVGIEFLQTRNIFRSRLMRDENLFVAHRRNRTRHNIVQDLRTQ